MAASCGCNDLPLSYQMQSVTSPNRSSVASSATGDSQLRPGTLKGVACRHPEAESR